MLDRNDLITIFTFASLVCFTTASAEEFKIPEIQSRVSDQFIIESIAKLDDFIEDIRSKEEIRGSDNVGFAAGVIINLGTLTGALVDQFLFKTKLLTPVFAGINEVSGVGKVGSLPAKLLQFTRSWMLASTTLQTVNSTTEKTFVVNVKDLALFRHILTQVRQHEVNILIKLWGSDPIKKARISDIEKTVFELRPSYKRIYDNCSSDPQNYKINTLIHIYRMSLWDYIRFITGSPEMITSQYAAGVISPTARRYINQEVLNLALRKCFKVPAEADSIFKDENRRFIAQILAVDALSKFVLISAAVTIIRFRHAPGKGSATAMAKLQASKLGTLIKPALDFFMKISPAVIAGIKTGTTVAISAYALNTVRQEFNKAKEDHTERRSSSEFLAITKKFFLVRSTAQIELLNSALTAPNISASDKEAIEAEIANWEIISAEFKS